MATYGGATYNREPYSGEGEPPAPVAPGHDFLSPVTIVNDSGHNAFPGFVSLFGGTFLVAYRAAVSHHGTGGEIVTRTSTDQGATWSSGTVILSTAGIDYRSASLTKLANNDVLLVAERRSDLGGGTDVPQGGVVVRYSGGTWGTPVVVDTGFTDWGRVMGPVLELANGDLLLTIYGEDTGDPFNSSAVMRSTDGGATWGVLATIAAGGAVPTQSWNETGLFLRNDGTVVAIIRQGVDGHIDQSESTDDGATWSALSRIISNASGHPKPVRLDDEVVFVYRDLDQTGWPSRIARSTDEGVTWVEENTFAASVGGAMVYAQPQFDLTGDLFIAHAYETTVGGSNSDVFFSRDSDSEADTAPPTADTITAELVEDVAVLITRTVQGTGATAGTGLALERKIGAGAWSQLGGSYDPAAVLELADDSFDLTGDDPSYRTRLTNAGGSILSNEVTVTLAVVVTPNKPTLIVKVTGGEPMIGVDEVTLESGPYSHPDDAPQLDAEYRVMLDGVEIVPRVIAAEGDDWRYPTIGELGPAEATLTAQVRHRALLGDVPVPSEWSDPKEFTLVEDVEDDPPDDVYRVRGTPVNYRSEYPYGTWRETWPFPPFDQARAVCPGDAETLWVTMRNNDTARSTSFGGGSFNADFLPGGRKFGCTSDWKYFCPTGGIKHQPGGVGDLKILFSHTPFCPDTPFIDQVGNVAANQIVTDDTLLFRWAEDPNMMCAGALAFTEDGDYGDTEDADALEAIIDAGGIADSIYYEWPDFGGLWKGDILLPDGTWLNLFIDKPFGSRHFTYNEVTGFMDWVERTYDEPEDGVVIEGWEEELDLAEVIAWMEANLPAGKRAICTQLRLQLDGREAKLTAPFWIDRDNCLIKKEGAGLNVEDLDFGGSTGEAARWSNIADGIKRAGDANTQGFAALTEAGEPRNFEVVITGANASRRYVFPSAYAFAFQGDRDHHWGPGGYLRHDPDEFSALAGRMAGSFMPNGNNRVYNQGYGASPFSWWGNQYHHGQGSAYQQITRSGPRGAVTAVTEVAQTEIVHWCRSTKGRGPSVNLPLEPIYCHRLKVELLQTYLDGTHQVRVTHQIHGPDTEETLVEIINGYRWDDGGVGFLARSLRADHSAEFYSIVVLSDSPAFSVSAFGSACDSLISINWNAFGTLGGSS